MTKFEMFSYLDHCSSNVGEDDAGGRADLIRLTSGNDGNHYSRDMRRDFQEIL
jgi:hypothetical protein